MIDATVETLLYDNRQITEMPGVSAVEYGTDYLPENLRLDFNGKLELLHAYNYMPKITHFETATVIGGRYPSVNGAIWINGATYFSDKMEAPGKIGGKPIHADDLLSIKAQRETLRANKVILIGGRDNFGHFLFEILPKIVLFKKYIRLGYKFLVLDNFPARFLDYCKAFSIGPESFLWVKDWANIQCNDLLVAGCLVHRHPVDRRPCLSLPIMNEIRDTVLNWSNNSSRKITSEPVLMISRRNERWRRIVNESSIGSLLAQSGIPILESMPHLLSAEDQVRQMYQAKVVVSPIGGASPSAMFMNAGATLIEISTNQIDGVFGHRIWCALAGVKVQQIIGYFDEDCVNNGVIAIDRDFKVNPRDVLSAVSRTFL